MSIDSRAWRIVGERRLGSRALFFDLVEMGLRHSRTGG